MGKQDVTAPEGIGNKAGKAASRCVSQVYHNHTSHFDFSSPMERRVEPVGSLSIERGMKQEDRSEFVFVLSSLKETPPSDNPAYRIGREE